LELSGVRDEDVATEADALRLLVQQKSLNFQPGTRFLYSDSGYFLLAEVVKRITGKPFSVFARERIFDPLQMRNSQFLDDYKRIVAHRATGYRRRKDGSYELATSNWETVGDAGYKLRSSTSRSGEPHCKPA